MCHKFNPKNVLVTFILLIINELIQLEPVLSKYYKML